MEKIEANFRAPLYLRSGHLQTIFSAWTRQTPEPTNTIKHRVPLSTRGSTFVFEDIPATVQQPDLGVLMLHGLGGSHASGYLRRIAFRLNAAGLRTLRIDLPGSGLSAALTDLPAHAGCSREVADVVHWAAQNLNIRRWILVGFSLGGNIALKLLNEWSSHQINLQPPSQFDQPHPRSSASTTAPLFHQARAEQLQQVEWVQAVIVSPPVDLRVCADNMSRSINRIYTRYFLKSLLHQVEMRSSEWPSWRSRPRLPLVKTIEEFDRRYTAPLAGFASVDDYYGQSSSITGLLNISIPIQLLIDRHDPIVPFSIFNDIRWNAATSVTVSRRGGHLGYLRHRSQPNEHWLDTWVCEQIVNDMKSL